MARPKDADSEKTIAAIVDAALAVMAETRSNESPSLRTVATRADVGLGTIQYYFGSKEELLEACLDGYYDRLGKMGVELIQQATDATPGREFMERVIVALYDFAYRERGLMALRVKTNAERGELHPRRQRDFMGAFATQAAKALEPHIEVDALDARMNIQAIASMMVRFTLMTESELAHLTDLEGADAREAARQYVVRAGRRLMRPSDG